eukprot:jgi/Chlat1/1007/Chrsp109S01441
MAAAAAATAGGAACLLRAGASSAASTSVRRPSLCPRLLSSCRQRCQASQFNQPESTRRRSVGPLQATHHSSNSSVIKKRDDGSIIFDEDGYEITEDEPAASTPADGDHVVEALKETTSDASEGSGGGMGGAGLLLGGALLGGIAALGFLTYYFREPINVAVEQLAGYLDDLGPLGYVAYVVSYVGLEVLAIPALPLTMSAGVLFGVLPGTILASVAGTIAATISFTIARYVARDKVVKMARNSPKFQAIDKAVGKDSFRVITLLRLSPLLPLSLSNYLYGLTSVELGPYVAASWLGMLPGTWAFVSAGNVSKQLLKNHVAGAALESSVNHGWTLGLGLAATAVATAYITRLAQKALKEAEEGMAQ